MHLLSFHKLVFSIIDVIFSVAMCTTGGKLLGQATPSLRGGGLLVARKVSSLVSVVLMIGVQVNLFLCSDCLQQ